MKRQGIAAALFGLGLLYQSEARADDSGADGWGVDINGYHRTRYEALANQFRAGLGENDQLLSLTTGVKMVVRRDAFSFVGELIDVRGYFDDLDGSVGSNDINALELVQAHVAIKTDRSETLVGRFTLDLGSRRLVGRNRFRTATNAFAGILTSRTTKRGERIKLFYTQPLVRRPDRPDKVRDNLIVVDDQDFNLQFWGAHYTRDWSDHLLTEGFVFGLHERDEPGKRETRDRDIYTAGGRVFGRPRLGHSDGEIEVGHQWGSRRDSAQPTDLTSLDVSAYYLHAELGFSFNSRTPLRVSVDFDYASGDRSADDGQQNRFDALFGPIAGDLGPTSLNTLITRSNLISPAISLEARPSRRTQMSLSWRPAWLASGTDGFGSSGVRDVAGSSGRFAGHQLHGRLRHDIVPARWTIDGGLSYFVNGRFFNEAPNANANGNPLYGYWETRFAF